MKRLVFLMIALALVCASPHHCLADLNDGLVAHYPFDGDAKDATGNGWDGTPQGATLTTDRFDEAASAYLFDGNDDYIHLNATLPVSTGSSTISVWVKIPPVGQGGLTAGERVGVIFGSLVSEGPGFNLGENWEIYSNGEVRIRFGRPTLDLFGSKDLRDGRWHNVVFIRDTAADQFYAYIDGYEEPLTPHDNAGTEDDSGMLHSIGRDQMPDNAFFHGVMDDLRIYNRALSKDEILILNDSSLFFDADHDWDIDTEDLSFYSHYFGGTYPVIEDGLVAYYPFNTNAKDASGYKNHGTPSPYGLVLTADRFGTERSAYLFDGDDDIIYLTRKFYIGGSNNTVAAWVKAPLPGHGGLEHDEMVGSLLSNFNNDDPSADWEINSDGKLHLYWNYGQADLVGTRDLRDNAWHHVAIVRDKGLDRFSAYIDGLVDPLTAHSTAGDDIPFFHPHYIGAPWYFHGIIDEVRVYDRVLAGGEINQLAHSQLGGMTVCFDADGDGDIDGSDTALMAKYFGVTGDVLWYRDADGDGYGDPDMDLARYFWDFQPTDGYVANPDDCDDDKADWHVGPSGNCLFEGYTDCVSPYTEHCHLPVSNVETKLVNLGEGNGIDVNKDKFAWRNRIPPGEVFTGASKRHIQSIQYFEYQTKRFLVVTVGDETDLDAANVSIVAVDRFGSEDGNDDKVVSQNLLLGDWETNPYDHAGGSQLIGEYLFIALEDMENHSQTKTGVWKIQRGTTPFAGYQYSIEMDSSDYHHSATAVTKLSDGTYFMAACVEDECNKIQFFKSTGTSLANDPGFHYIDQWNRYLELNSGEDDDWADCAPQNINMVVDTNGSIYLVMFGVERIGAPGELPCGTAAHDDHIYSYKLRMTDDYQIKLDFKDKVDIGTGDNCDCLDKDGQVCGCGMPGCYIPLGVSGTNFDAGSGLWIAPDGKDDIAVMATEHYDSCGYDPVADDGKSRWGVTENWDD